mgnify:CR=1 FL=1
MDWDEQVDFWRRGALDDLDAARVLLEKRKFGHSLFCMHLAVEKALKARVMEATQTLAPKIHNLVRLAELSGLETSPERRRILLEFNEYCMAGRYPDARNVPANGALCNAEIVRAEELLKWLIEK